MFTFTTLSIQQLYQENRESLQLNWFSGFSGAQRLVSGNVVSTADQVGHLNLMHPSRIQVFGQQEIKYYQRLSNNARTYQTAEIIACEPSAIIVTQGLLTPPYIFITCHKKNIPLFLTPLPAAQVINYLRIYLSKKLAPQVTMHGVFIDVLGVGVLITGKSGLGKSELGLELISRNHGLIADDVVKFARIAPDIIEGKCPALLQNLLEVRGLGLLDIKAIFGETAIRRKMSLKLIVLLVRRSTLLEEGYAHLLLNAQFQHILGIPIRKIIIPVVAGRNIAVLLEAAVRNTILQLRGINTFKEFIERQRKTIKFNSLNSNIKTT